MSDYCLWVHSRRRVMWKSSFVRPSTIAKQKSHSFDSFYIWIALTQLIQDIHPASFFFNFTCWNWNENCWSSGPVSYSTFQFHIQIVLWLITVDDALDQIIHWICGWSRNSDHQSIYTMWRWCLQLYRANILMAKTDCPTAYGSNPMKFTLSIRLKLVFFHRTMCIQIPGLLEVNWRISFNSFRTIVCTPIIKVLDMGKSSKVGQFSISTKCVIWKFQRRPRSNEKGQYLFWHCEIEVFWTRQEIIWKAVTTNSFRFYSWLWFQVSLPIMFLFRSVTKWRTQKNLANYTCMSVQTCPRSNVCTKYFQLSFLSSETTDDFPLNKYRKPRAKR